MMGFYLDWNATAPLRPKARAAMLAALDHVGNPSSIHAFGRRARRFVEDAREQVAELVGVNPADITFTGGGTEANNQALALAAAHGRRILVGATEHASVLEAAPGAVRVPVDGDGLIDRAALVRLLAADPTPALVSIQAVNSETGVVQPMVELATLVHDQGGWLHSDAVQAVGRLPVDMGDWGADLLTLSAHKIGGPQGVGALVAHPGIPLAPLLKGGGQERRMRAGTENVAGIAGFGAAAAAALAGLDEYAGLTRLRDRLETAVRERHPPVLIPGAGAPRVANTSCIVLPGAPANGQLMAFDLARVAVSAGSACSSGKVKSSHVLMAMGLGEDLAGCAIRVSLGWDSTGEEVDRFLESWSRIAARVPR